MANRFLNNIKINDSYTLPAADGTADQIIKTNGTGELSFIDQGDVVAGEADKAKSVILRVKNSTASAMSKGQVVCEAVSATPPSGNLIEVALADNNGTNTMPALGVLNEDLDAAGGANDEGDAIMFGKVSGIDTSAFSVGDEVFVDDTPGGLTTTKPTGVKYIQKVGVVIRDDASNGTIEVFGAGRVNDVPTPLYIDHANQRLGIGTTSPSYRLDVNGIGRFSDTLRVDTTTDTALVLNSTDNGPIYMAYQRNGDRHAYVGFGGSNDQFYISNEETTGSLYFSTVGGGIYVNSNGNVGIGTTSPSQKLDVSGNIKMTETAATSDTDKFVVLDSGVLKYRTGSQIVSDLPTDGRYVAVAGDTMTGDLILGSNQVNFKTNGSSTSPNFFGHRSAVDLDTRFTSSEGGWGYTTFDSSSSNTPGGSLHNANGLLSFNTHSGNYGHQIAMTTNTAKLYFRTRNNSSWQSWQQVFTDAYHPNADKWTTARTITLGGDLSGSVSMDGSANVTLSAQVVNNSHTHDDRYVELTGDTMTGNLEISKSSAKLILTDSGTGQASVDVRNSSLYARWILDTDDLFRVYNQTSGFDAFAIKSSGNVGIGTAGPSYLLDVNEDDNVVAFRVTGGGGGAAMASFVRDVGATGASVNINAQSNFPQIQFVSTGNTFAIGGDTSGNFKISDNTAIGTNDRITIDNTGNVGIGTTTPDSKLHISRGNSNGSGLLLHNTTGGAGQYIDLDFLTYTMSAGYANPTATIRIIDDGAYSGDITFRTKGNSIGASQTEKMRIDGATGNVGIGTTSPSEKLHVAGNMRLQNQLYDSTNSQGTFNDVLTKVSAGTEWKSISDLPIDSRYVAVTGDTMTGLLIAEDGIRIGSGNHYTDGRASLTFGEGSPTNDSMYIEYDGENLNGDNNAIFIGSNKAGVGDVLSVTYGGNVGIGVTDPDAALDVSGNIKMTETAATSDTDKFVVSDSGVLKYRTGAEIRDDIDAIGGSGTGGTIALFTASGTDLGDSIITQSSQPDKITIGGQLSLQGSGDVLNISHYSGSAWFIDTSTGDDIFFGAPASNTQNVGVQGDLYAYGGDLGTKSSGLFTNLISQTGNSYFNAGNVGIGTTSPSAMLHVSGSQDFVLIESTANSDATYRSKTTLGYYGSGTGIGSATNCWNVYDFNAGSERMRINSSGNVGIGTTSPQAMLDISDSSNDVNLTSTNNYAINTGGAANVRHYKNINLETPEMEWSIGGSTDLNWKKLATIVINDANYSGFGAEVEITDFSGNYGSSVAEYGDVYRGGLSIYHRAGTGVEPKEGIITIHNDMSPYIRIYKIAGSGNSSYEIQAKSPGNYRQIYVKLKAGIGNQVASITPHANDTNGSTSGGTAYTPDSYTSSNQFKTGFTTMTTNRGIVLDKLSVNLTSPAGKFDVRTDSVFGNCRIVIRETTNQNPVLAFYRPTGSAQTAYPWYLEAQSSNFHIKTGSAANIGSESVSAKVTINSSGNVGIGQTNPSTYKLDVSGTIRATGDVIAYSDIRVKENIKTINNAVDKVKALRGVEYNKIDSTEKSIGVIAQEIEEVIPEVVREDDQGMKSVAYGNITAVLIEAIKEQQEQIDELKNQLNAFTK